MSTALGHHSFIDLLVPYRTQEKMGFELSLFRLPSGVIVRAGLVKMKLKETVAWHAGLFLNASNNTLPLSGLSE